jgi:DNA-binding response OmpR family regulator
MPDKIILIAHRDAAIRDRFATALSDARHAFVTAATVEMAHAAARDAAHPISLAVVDAGLSEDGLGWIHELRGALTWPVLIFAGSVRSVADTRALLAVPVAGYIN